jgi:signal peptidase II
MLKRLVIILLVLLNIGCDQWSKEMVRQNVDYGERITLIGQNFTLTKVENEGAMLGWGRDLSPFLKTIILQIVPLALLLVLLIRILQKQNLNKWLVFAFACVIGGGIGNLIDRIAHGEVTDFFHIEIWFFKTGIFNMADVSVTMGVLLILLLSFKNRKLEM